MEDSMPRSVRKRRLFASLIAVIAGLVVVAAGPSGASAFCNPSKVLKQGCYDGTKLKPPQEEADKPLANSSCEELELRVAASIGQQACRAANLSEADAHGRAETISGE